MDHGEIPDAPQLEKGAAGDAGRDPASTAVFRALGLGEAIGPMIGTTRAV
jgi:hypothetical protein